MLCGVRMGVLGSVPTDAVSVCIRMIGQTLGQSRVPRSQSTDDDIPPYHPIQYTQLIADCWTHVGPLRGKTVYVTGHSLGGGFSVFMSVKLWKVGG